LRNARHQYQFSIKKIHLVIYVLGLGSVDLTGYPGLKMGIYLRPKLAITILTNIWLRHWL